MARRASALLWLLAAACGEPPPPPQPPPTPQERLDRSREKLRRLAEEQLKAEPQDARLQLWVAAFQGLDTLPGLKSLPPSPLAAVVRCSWTLFGDAAPEAREAEEVVKALEDIAPTSSHGPLFKARRLLLGARDHPEAVRSATEAVEEALRRNRWDCPVDAFHAWSLAWLENHEPDAFARACFRPRYANRSRAVMTDLADVAEGLACAPTPPKLDARRPADVLRRLVEERFLKSPRAEDVIPAHAAHPRALQAQFLLAWRQKDLDTARSASTAFEAYGRLDAALGIHRSSALGGRDIGPTLEALFADGSLKPPFAFAGKSQPASDADRRQEATAEALAGAKAHGAALRAESARTRPFVAEVADRLPPQSPRRNYLGLALRDRDVLLTEPFPKDRAAPLLEAAFDSLPDGAEAYAWVIRDNLIRPKTLPSRDLERRFGEAKNMDLYAILRARRDDVAVERRPSPAEARKAGGAWALHGYCLQLQDVVKAGPADAVEWLPEPAGLTPSASEVMIAETLRAATGQDFGPAWPRWKAFLETGK